MRKFLGIALIGVIVANGALASFLAVQGYLWRIIKALCERRILTPLLLGIISAGGVAVFAYLMRWHEIHEDVLWIRTLELAAPCLTATYAIYSIVTEIRKRDEL